MRLEFVLPSKDWETACKEYIEEFYVHNSAINGTGGLNHTPDFDVWLDKVISSHNGIVKNKNRVPASTFLVLDENKKLVGMVNIRHELSEYLIASGSGHIGYSIRPTERRKGYATELLRKALLICKNEHNVDTALLGCYKDNIGSKKTILKNGGVLQREIPEENGKTTLAFHINLKN